MRSSWWNEYWKSCNCYVIFSFRIFLDIFLLNYLSFCFMILFLGLHWNISPFFLGGGGRQGGVKIILQALTFYHLSIISTCRIRHARCPLSFGSLHEVDCWSKNLEVIIPPYLSFPIAHYMYTYTKYYVLTLKLWNFFNLLTTCLYFPRKKIN